MPTLETDDLETVGRREYTLDGGGNNNPLSSVDIFPVMVFRSLVISPVRLGTGDNECVLKVSSLVTFPVDDKLMVEMFTNCL